MQNVEKIEQTIEYEELNKIFNIPEGMEIEKLIVDNHATVGIDFVLLITKRSNLINKKKE